MRNDSSLNYNTKSSKIQNFKDFEKNIRKEKDELEKISRNFLKNKDNDYSLPTSGSDKIRYNKLTHKSDSNISKQMLDDLIKDLDDDVEDTKHKYKIVDEVDESMDMDQDMTMPGIEKSDKDFTSNGDEITSYMFFGNLRTILRMVSEIYELDEDKVNDILNDGHNWAEDHITTAKVQLTHVYNFMMNKPMKENHHLNNYMFFENLQSMIQMCDNLLDFDEQEIDEVLQDGHDWAEDHISSAKENIEQVHDFLKNEFSQ